MHVRYRTIRTTGAAAAHRLCPTRHGSTCALNCGTPTFSRSPACGGIARGNRAAFQVNAAVGLLSRDQSICVGRSVEWGYWGRCWRLWTGCDCSKRRCERPDDGAQKCRRPESNGGCGVVILERLHKAVAMDRRAPVSGRSRL